MTDSYAAKLRSLFRREKRTIIATALVLMIWYVPLFPYTPRCYEQHEPTIVFHILLADNYKKALTDELTVFGIPYVSIGRLVLLPFWKWFADPDSWVANASNRAVRHFVDKSFGGPVDKVPAWVVPLIEAAREPDGYIELECPLVRAVAIEGW